MALLILALLQRIFLMSSLMLLLVWLIFFMVLIKLLPIRSEERFSRNAETDLVCRLLLEKKKTSDPLPGNGNFATQYRSHTQLVSLSSTHNLSNNILSYV